MGNRANRRQRRAEEQNFRINMSLYNNDKNIRKIDQRIDAHAKTTRRRKELRRLQAALKKEKSWRKLDDNLVQHAIKELELVGYNTSSDFFAQDILNIVRLFSSQGHSGTSAEYMVNVLEKLLRFQTLTPILGTDGEWVHVHTREDGTELYQNNRLSSVFKENDVAYDIDGAFYRHADGFVARRPMLIEFPYVQSDPVDWNDVPEEKRFAYIVTSTTTETSNQES